MAFDHEKLNVYQRSLDSVLYADILLQELPKRLSVSDQLDRSSTSMSLNIAEGNGKFTAKDRCKFFDIARGSALESAACLDVLERKGKIDFEQANTGKQILLEVVSMLVGLIRSQEGSRVYEEPTQYGEEDQD